MNFWAKPLPVDMCQTQIGRKLRGNRKTPVKNFEAGRKIQFCPKYSGLCRPVMDRAGMWKSQGIIIPEPKEVSMKKSYISTSVIILLVFAAGYKAGQKSRSGKIEFSSNSTVTRVKGVFNTDYYPTALSMIRSAKKSVHLIMFAVKYYEGKHQTDTLLMELRNAGRRGADVRVVLEGGDDEFLGKAFKKEAQQVANFLEQGGYVDVRFDPRWRTTHSKLLVVDGHNILVGSTNWTTQALTSNNESNALIVGHINDFENYFEKVWKESHEPGEDTVIVRPSVSQILKNPDKFDGRIVEVEGLAKNINFKTSKSGRKYTTFKLQDNYGRTLKVYYGKGHPRISENSGVLVKGVYRKIKRIGRYRYKNQIDASEVKKL